MEATLKKMSNNSTSRTENSFKPESTARLSLNYYIFICSILRIQWRLSQVSAGHAPATMGIATGQADRAQKSARRLGCGNQRKRSRAKLVHRQAGTRDWANTANYGAKACSPLQAFKHVAALLLLSQIRRFTSPRGLEENYLNRPALLMGAL